jgi:hypothetical protein
MLSWFKPKPEPLKPLPLSQRLKTYSAASGFVYQYIFEGLAGPHHVFSVTATGAAPVHITIEFSPAALASCEAQLGSPLRWQELYALAKLSLFAALDEAATPAQLPSSITPSGSGLLAHLTTLNLA